MIEAALTVFIVVVGPTLVLFIAWSGILMTFLWWRNEGRRIRQLHRKLGQDPEDCQTCQGLTELQD